MKVKIKKLSKEAVIPEYKTPGAAGCDISSIEEVVIDPGESKFIKTGISIECPEGYFFLIAPRSSLVLKNNLDVPNSVGIVDSDYRGEYLICLRNLGKEKVIIAKGERIGQLVFLPAIQVEFEEVDELSTTKRGEGGFGSTGNF